MVSSGYTMALGRFSRCCRTFLHDPSKSQFGGLIRSGWLERCTGAKRYLLSEDVVRLQDFQQRKLAVAHLVTGSQGNYFEFFNQKLLKKELILKDELKLLLHLCQSVEDMVTARDAIYRYHEENQNFAFGDFRFGPLFMRLCYELGLEEMAAEILTDKSMRGFFKDSTSFNIAIDMLFTKGLYQNALDILRDMKNQGVAFNKDTFTLACGCCYRWNTPESYKICTDLIEEGITNGQLIPRHAYCFAVALALRQNDTEKAQKLFSHIINTDSRICQNLKVVMLAMSGALMDAISITAAALLPKSPTFVRKLEFAQEVVDILRARSKDGPHVTEVEEVVVRLERAGQVTHRSVDDMLCRTPPGTRRHTAVMEERRLSRRTLKPLRSTLLAE